MNWALFTRLYRLPETDLDLLGAPELNGGDIILEDAFLPPHRGSWSHDDMTPLLRIASQKKLRIVLELGTGFGNLTANICRFSGAFVYTVNALPRQMSGNLVSREITKDEIGRVYRNFGYKTRVAQIYSNTLDFNYRDYIDDGCVDMAIIDACHDTDYVMSDFFNIVPAMSSDGIVLLHDTHPSMYDHLHGSYIACMRLRRKGFNIKRISGTWWGLWRAGEACNSLDAVSNALRRAL